MFKSTFEIFAASLSISNASVKSLRVFAISSAPFGTAWLLNDRHYGVDHIICICAEALRSHVEAVFLSQPFSNMSAMSSFCVQTNKWSGLTQRFASQT